MKHKKIREIIINSGLVLCSITFLYLIMEFVVFRFFLHWLPLRTYAMLDPGIRIFAQSSKKNTIPKDYALILGDSYALGLGDWFLDANKNINPDFHSAHVIYKMIGTDVITLGYAGADSLRGMVAFPKSFFDYSKKTLLYSLEQPRYIIVYFYEGNDLDDNVREIDVRFKKKYDLKKIFNTNYFRNFLEEVIVAQDSLSKKSETFQLKNNFYVYKYSKALVKNFQDIIKIEAMHWPLGGYGPWMTEPSRNKNQKKFINVGKVPLGAYNKVIMNNKVDKIPDGLQAPGLELSDEQINLGVYVFEQCLRYLQDQFPDSKIGVVYIPSPLSSYHLSTEFVHIQPYDPKPEAQIYDANLVNKKSNIISSRIKKVVEKQNVKFIDLRPLILEYTKNEYVHGPKEWFHFNKKGHTLLGETVVDLIRELDKSR